MNGLKPAFISRLTPKAEFIGGFRVFYQQDYALGSKPALLVGECYVLLRLGNPLAYFKTLPEAQEEVARRIELLGLPVPKVGETVKPAAAEDDCECAACDMEGGA